MRAALESEEPFGGVHVLFGGDFLQMKPSGGNPSLAIECKYGPNNIRGRKLWKECINEFMELKTNIRAQSEDGTTSQFARTCTNLRKGNPTTSDIAMLNSRLVNNLDTAVANASDLAVWIAATHKICNEINGKYFTNFVQLVNHMYELLQITFQIKFQCPDQKKLRETNFMEFRV